MSCVCHGPASASGQWAVAAGDAFQLAWSIHDPTRGRVPKGVKLGLFDGRERRGGWKWRKGKRE